MEVRSRQDAKSVCIKRRHGAISAGEKKRFVCNLKAVALVCVGTGEEENEEEESDLSLRRRCLRCGGGFARRGGWRSASSMFLLGKAGYICVSAVFASRVLPRFRNRTCPLNEKYPECLYHDC